MSPAKFFRAGNNSAWRKGTPWIARIANGLHRTPPCPSCGTVSRFADSEIEVILDSKRGTEWPDVLGCGSRPLFIISERVLVAWSSIGIPDPPRHPVVVTGGIPAALSSGNMPEYFWLDGTRLGGAAIDFDASGYVNVSFCSFCGKRTQDISATHRRQRDEKFPFVFLDGSWDGKDLFTTDLSPAVFFCTERVVQCASEHGLTNFRFVPIEKGPGYSGSGISY